jgi:indolepyruvate ferredoxin oxidoreductase
MSIGSVVAIDSLDHKYRVEEGRIYLSGIQAILRVMLDQHRADRRRGLNTAGLVSGYPGSPVGGVDLELGRHRTVFAAHNIVHLPGLNEELAATAAFGTQLLHSVPGAKYDGVHAMWFGKAPGVDRAGDAFHHANFHGTGRNGGVLAVAGDDPQARSTIIPSDSNAVFASFHMPVLCPGDVQDVLDFGLHGYALSRAAGLWVGFKLVTDIAESAGTVTVSPDRVHPIVPEVEFDGRPFEPRFRANEAGPPMLEVEREIIQARLHIAHSYARANKLNHTVLDTPQAKLGIVGVGKAYFDLREALNGLGFDDAMLRQLGIRLLKIGMVYPIDSATIREFASGLSEIIVVEDKRPLIELAMRDVLYGLANRPAILGKSEHAGAPLFPAHGELSGDVIAASLGRFMKDRFGLESVARRLAELDHPASNQPPVGASRMPYFCSGCPHNRSLHVPAGAVVGAGIGCHIMTLWMGPVFGEATGYTQMGGEGAQWVGLAPFSSTDHYFQNLGDGTFAHSGSLAIRFAVASGINVTYKLLYNSAVAMTGGQAVTGGKSVARIVSELESEGVKRIVVTTDEPGRYKPGSLPAIATVRHRDDLVAVERELAAMPGVTVLINDQQCAAEKRRLRKRGKQTRPPRSVLINHRVCEGCGDCGAKSNCLSVEPVATEFGRKTAIHLSSCNQDYSCLLGDCPSFVTVESGKRAAAAPRKIAPPPIEETLPEPTLRVPAEQFSVYLMGIGGTGVVTVNQILGTAAALAGRFVRTIDDTGSSQKAGPVVSHLRIGTQEREGTNRIPIATADLYLAFDLLVAAEPTHLKVASPAKTIAVAATHKVPTGEMVADARKHYPSTNALRARVDAATRSAEAVYLDTQAIAERLFGDHMAANMILVGAAYQQGALPLPVQAIERAIALNGAGVEMNIAAFRWGRLAVLAPERVELAGRPTTPQETPLALAPEARAIVDSVEVEGELRRILESRVPELIAFQNATYATRYAEFVARVRQREEMTVPGRDAIAQATAVNLYKLMAYKDEYEVARLLLDAGIERERRAAFGQDSRVTYHLMPTFLRSLGVKRKVQLGSWFRGPLAVLRALKILRGTPFDVLGATKVRRIERALIEQYRQTMEQVTSRLSSQTYEAVLAIAKLPDLVRGYEGVKLTGVARYRRETRQLLSRLSLTVPWPTALAAVPEEPEPAPAPTPVQQAA